MKGELRMRKLLRKISALLLAVVMVLSMCVTVFATDHVIGGEKPTPDDVGSITVKGVQEGDTVSIYKIVKAFYNDYGFVKYEPVVANSIVEPTAPKSSEIEKLFTDKKLTLETSGIVAPNASSIVFSGLKIGTYAIKVEAGKENLNTYSTMIASVFYVTSENQTAIRDGVVSADDKWSIEGDTAYAKSSKKVVPEKVIVDEKGNPIENKNTVGKGDAVAKGDTVSFKISGKIPAYDPEYYTNPTYVITDTLNDGLDFADDTQEKVQEAADEKFGTGNVTVKVSGRTLKIEFISEYITTLANEKAEKREFSFTYSATLNGKNVNFDPSTNTVNVNYSKNSDETTTSEDVVTYHYTFAFNGEVIKVDDTNKSLKDAEFGLFTDADCKNPVIHADDKTKVTGISGSDGKLSFTGLDNKVYYMKEIKTPSAEYKLNDTVYKIEFIPTFAANGKLESYIVSIKDVTNNGEEIKTEYKYNEETKEATITDDKVNVVKIQNTKLGTLPSTGGVGTYFFTILGVLVMSAVAGMFVIRYKKDKEAGK